MWLQRGLEDSQTLEQFSCEMGVQHLWFRLQALFNLEVVAVTPSLKG